MENEKLNVLRQVVEEGFGNADLYVIDQLIDDNIIEHQFGIRGGKEGLKKGILHLSNAFSNHQYDLVNSSVNEDLVWVHYKSSGEHTGPFMGHKPTGKRFTIDVMDLARIKNGKIVEHWGVPDRFALLSQLGFLQPPTQKSLDKKSHPGVYVPPPMIYVACFFGSVLLQKILSIESVWLHSIPAQVIGWIFAILFLIINVFAIGKFIISKNTIVPIKPATSLQTTGIYRYSRNPMYLGLLFLYCGIGVFFGNWWTFVLLPLLIIIIQLYVIRKEEKYLQEAFSDQYELYKKKVRRWI